MNKKNRKTLICIFLSLFAFMISCKKNDTQKKSSQNHAHDDNLKKDSSDSDTQENSDDSESISDDTPISDDDDNILSHDDDGDDSVSGDHDDVIVNKSEFEVCAVDTINPSSDCGPDFVCFPKVPNGKDGVCAKICEDSDMCSSYVGKTCKGKNAPGGKPICHSENKNEFDTCDPAQLQFCSSTSGLACVTYSDQNNNSFTPICLKACDPTAADSCAGNIGTYCYSTDNKNGYCWKVAGEHEECGVKTASVCDQDHLCVPQNETSASKCYKLCPTGQADQCPAEAPKCVGFQDGNSTINACIPE